MCDCYGPDSDLLPWDRGIVQNTAVYSELGHTPKHKRPTGLRFHSGRVTILDQIPIYSRGTHPNAGTADKLGSTGEPVRRMEMMEMMVIWWWW